MSRGCILRPLPFWRRAAAAVALLALLFASLAISLPHATAMPAQGLPAMQADQAQPRDHDHASHRHGPADPGAASESGTSQSGTSNPGAMPCENGCVFCKDCALCSLATAALPTSLPAGDGFDSFAPARVPQPADIHPARAIEPPRT